MNNKDKYYINKDKKLFGFNNDGSQDFLITNDMKPITIEEIEEMRKATLEEIEEARIISINNKVEEIITKPYPFYKQLNIRGQLLPYTIDDLENMNMFIDTTRYIGKDAKSNGTKVEDINWAGLDEYSTSDEITQAELLSIRKLVKAI